MKHLELFLTGKRAEMDDQVIKEYTKVIDTFKNFPMFLPMNAEPRVVEKRDKQKELLDKYSELNKRMSSDEMFIQRSKQVEEAKKPLIISGFLIGEFNGFFNLLQTIWERNTIH